MAVIRLQRITAGEPFTTARILLQGVGASGTFPLYPRIRFSDVGVSGESIIFSDVYEYSGTDWEPVHIESWDGGDWR